MANFGVSFVFFYVILGSACSINTSDLDAPFDRKIDQRGLKMNWIERKIKGKIESFREVLKDGDPVFGIPVLDPYIRNSDLIKVNTSLVLASTDVNDFSVVGLSSYSVDDVRVSLSNFSATVRLSWTGIKAKGDYKLNGDFNIPYVGKAPIYGNGTARALVYTAWIEGKITFGVENDEIVTASDLNLSWDIVNPQIRVDGLFGGQELGGTINQLIEDLIPKLDAAYHDQLQKVLQEKVLKLINDYLSDIKDPEDEQPFSLLQFFRKSLQFLF